MAHRSAHDPTKHITAPLLARQYTVRDQKCRSTQMVGYDAVRDCMVAVWRNT